MDSSSPASASQGSISTAETATYLAKILGGTAASWWTRLANDRKPGRVKKLLMIEPGPGRPRYSAVVVEAFVRDQLEKRQTLAVRPSKSMTRRFTPTILAMTHEQGADEPFVLLVTGAPLATYQLSADEARNLARRLINAAEEIDVRPSP